MRRERGFTLLELTIVIGVISVLAAIFLDRALVSMEAAERMAMENQARMIGSALQLQMAALITSGRERDMASLARGNPLDWLQTKPPNYLGELAVAPGDDHTAGNWYYDVGSGETVYLVRRGAGFDADARGRKEVRYRVRVVHEKFGDERADVVGAVFQPVLPYRWR